MTNEVEFVVTESGQPDVPVLSVGGEVDVASAPELHAHLHRIIEQNTSDIIVDTTEVTFIDSTGLGVLVDAEKTMRDTGRQMRLVVNQPQIIRVLELTGLDEVFTIVPSANDEVRS
ncbi:MAG: STAS domain-containing protein [Acidimicrobiales bacterium]